MLSIFNDYSLKEHNTFGIDVRAAHYLSFTDVDEFVTWFRTNKSLQHKPRLFIGSGSNLLFTEDFNGVVIEPRSEAITVVEENEEFVFVEAGAGLEWDDFVAYCVARGWGGVENLSLIPGKVGSAPVQNIGAYGVEAEAVVDVVEGIELESLTKRTITAKACHFGYRDSIFKNDLRGKFLITSVRFRLSKKPVFNVRYGDVSIEVERLGGESLENIRQAIVSIRESKLPDTAVFGNAGSFFKNPVVAKVKVDTLKTEFPDMPVYSIGEDQAKLAAGWLIDQAGWKGKSVGNAAVHDKQALVLINKGGASGKEIFALSELILSDVQAKFGVTLEREVNVIGRV